MQGAYIRLVKERITYGISFDVSRHRSRETGN